MNPMHQLEAVHKLSRSLKSMLMENAVFLTTPARAAGVTGCAPDKEKRVSTSPEIAAATSTDSAGQFDIGLAQNHQKRGPARRCEATNTCWQMREAGYMSFFSYHLMCVAYFVGEVVCRCLQMKSQSSFVTSKEARIRMVTTWRAGPDWARKFTDCESAMVVILPPLRMMTNA